MINRREWIISAQGLLHPGLSFQNWIEMVFVVVRGIRVPRASQMKISVNKYSRLNAQMFSFTVENWTSKMNLVIASILCGQLPKLVKYTLIRCCHGPFKMQCDWCEGTLLPSVSMLREYMNATLRVFWNTMWGFLIGNVLELKYPQWKLFVVTKKDQHLSGYPIC